MSTFDRSKSIDRLVSQLSPHYIGFPSLMDDFLSFAGNPAQSYPPCNIIEVEKNAKYQVQVALAGWEADDVDVMVEKGTLTIRGQSGSAAEREEALYVYHGIATRSFQRRVKLAADYEVISADMKNGLLNINIERHIPEAEKPKVIDIKS